jgi:hypothetical protein
MDIISSLAAGEVTGNLVTTRWSNAGLQSARKLDIPHPPKFQFSPLGHHPIIRTQRGIGCTLHALI